MTSLAGKAALVTGAGEGIGRACVCALAAADARVAAVDLNEAGAKETISGSAGSAEAATPLGRIARPEEVAAVARFLASDEASYVTGSLMAG